MILPWLGAAAAPEEKPDEPLISYRHPFCSAPTIVEAIPRDAKAAEVAQALQETGNPLRARAAEYLHVCGDPLGTYGEEATWQQVCGRELERATDAISPPWQSPCSKPEETGGGHVAPPRP